MLLMVSPPLQIIFCFIFSGLQHTTFIITKFSFSLYCWSCTSFVHKKYQHVITQFSLFIYLLFSHIKTQTCTFIYTLKLNLTKIDSRGIWQSNFLIFLRQRGHWRSTLIHINVVFYNGGEIVSMLSTFRQKRIEKPKNLVILSTEESEKTVSGSDMKY